ncbi:MAG: catalase family protein [Acidobacteria bacterium]|nr:catalase family protein [Acidobacteriota bacterium]
MNLEHVPAGENDAIQQIVDLTIEQMKGRYPAGKTILRGVHPKDHGCVSARFEVHSSLPETLRTGIFANPGRVYEAWIRYSNASLRIGRDSAPGKNGPHGSRGMAIKLMGVTGDPLLPEYGPMTQDLLMINQPVFAFSNVEDYLALSEAIKTGGDESEGKGFFERKVTGAAAARLARTGTIVRQVKQATAMAQAPFTFQPPPVSPVDNQYFSGSAFLFGEGRAMKFSAKPVDPHSGEAPDGDDENYLRTALHKRLTAPDAQEIVFDFLVQVRSAAELEGKIETEIEDACREWTDPFVSVATIRIPPQDFETEERRAYCERLVFTPWHGLREHRPLGGINRLRLAVYKASAALRGGG